MALSRVEIIMSSLGSIKDPLLGDSELISVAFEGNDCILKINQNNPLNFESYVYHLFLRECLYVDFNSNHMQNVIDDILIIERSTETFIQNKRINQKLADITTNLGRHYIINADKFKIIVITPISGIEFIGLMQDLELFIESGGV